MMRYRRFDPADWLDRTVILRNRRYTFVLDDQVFGGFEPAAVHRIGGKADVYQLRAEDDGTVHALKVFNKRHSVDRHVTTAALLNIARLLPGLRVCTRAVVSDTEAFVLGEPGLAWAIIMPWIEGRPWADYIENEAPSRAESIAIAQVTARQLATLESKELAHTDISSTNVIVAASGRGPDVQFIDVEEIFGHLFDKPVDPSAGTRGYGHPHAAGQSCWQPAGDRFAGAILLTEMLTLHADAIHEQVADASLFAPDELCADTGKSRRVRRELAALYPSAASLFDRVWSSSGLRDCPALKEWADALDALGRPQPPVPGPRRAPDEDSFVPPTPAPPPVSAPPLLPTLAPHRVPVHPPVVTSVSPLVPVSPPVPAPAAPDPSGDVPSNPGITFVPLVDVDDSWRAQP
ncbi:hypothetical protein [Dactylosporangium sp. NPDC048998]|uniref:hypothetical protein n=1 Tax=Dactylosporangium sp. NPDC048998 TaxID=3363976 RepID=UPI00371B647D